MAMTFSEYWPDANEKDIRERIAPEFIRELRYSLGVDGRKMTMAEFQRVLNERVGEAGPGDVSKQAKWESKSKDKSKRQYPEPRMQQGIIQLHIERGPNSAYLKDVGFPLAPWVETFRYLFFSNNFEVLKPLLDREIDCGPRGESDVHRDTWAYLRMLRGNVASLEGEHAIASEYYDDAAGMHIETKSLSITVRENSIGAAFNNIQENDELSDKEARIEYEKILETCNELHKLEPKNHNYRRNRLRVMSRLDKEQAFTTEFEDLALRSDQDMLEKMLMTDKDQDFANARAYKCVVDFLRSRRSRIKMKGFATPSLMIFLATVTSLIFILGASMKSAHAVDTASEFSMPWVIPAANSMAKVDPMVINMMSSEQASWNVEAKPAIVDNQLDSVITAAMVGVGMVNSTEPAGARTVGHWGGSVDIASSEALGSMQATHKGWEFGSKQLGTNIQTDWKIELAQWNVEAKPAIVDNQLDAVITAAMVGVGMVNSTEPAGARTVGHWGGSADIASSEALGSMQATHKGWEFGSKQQNIHSQSGWEFGASLNFPNIANANLLANL